MESINGTPTQRVEYPVLEAYVTQSQGSVVRERIVSSCCFHDLTSASDEDLAGMGLAIIGNIVKYVGKDLYDETLFAKLLLKRGPGDQGQECPWPGMPNDAPLPLDLTLLPFDSAMFLDESERYTTQSDGTKTENGMFFKYRVDRLQLMQRIAELWVPWLRGKLAHAYV